MEKIIKFLKGFQKSDSIPFSCPFCHEKSLSLLEESWYEHDKSKYSPTTDHLSPEECVEYIYTSVYQCKTKSCEQKVISSGIGYVDIEYDYGDCDEYGRPIQKYYNLYKPLFFLPTLYFFDIPKNTPRSIHDQLVHSFSLFPQSPSAAANCVRTSVEELLDLHNIPAKYDNGSRISLGNRIKDEIPKCSQLHILKDCIEAIKWLGNAGSHEFICTDDVIDAYEMMVFVLNELYSNKQIILDKVKKINELKGPLNRQARNQLKK